MPRDSKQGRELHGHLDNRSHWPKKVEVSGDFGLIRIHPFLAVADLGDTEQLLQRVTICALPDNVLLEIFSFYLVVSDGRGSDRWHKLVHVCQRWRCVVFASPRRLDLQLLCTNNRPVQESLDFWPQLPILIQVSRGMSQGQGADNIISAFKRPKCIHRIDLPGVPNPLLGKISEMKEPLPSLTYLALGSHSKMAPVLPDSFLGAHAPLLRKLRLYGIPFPALGKLLSSTSGLVTLQLLRIPQSGHIAPKAMIKVLSALPRLQSFELHFLSPRPEADRESRYTPPLTRIILPTLAFFSFHGDSEYLEDISFPIDAPRLTNTYITFFNQLLFDTPLLRRFIDRIELLKAPQQACICFYNSSGTLTLTRTNGTYREGSLSFRISCTPLDWLLSSIARVCSSSLPPFSTLVRLQIERFRPDWDDNMENTHWLELLQPFAFVEDLVLLDEVVGFVLPALQEFTGEGATNMLPALQNFFIQGPEPLGPIYEAIEKFVNARRLSGHPIAVHYNARRVPW